MEASATEKRSDEAHADRAKAKVAAQRQIVKAMRIDDPQLAEACALLRQMEQSAAIAEMSCIFSQYARR